MIDSSRNLSRRLFLNFVLIKLILTVTVIISFLHFTFPMLTFVPNHRDAYHQKHKQTASQSSCQKLSQFKLLSLILSLLLCIRSSFLLELFERLGRNRLMLRFTSRRVRRWVKVVLLSFNGVLNDFRIMLSIGDI
jgi:hypothetical protein